MINKRLLLRAILTIWVSIGFLVNAFFAYYVRHDTASSLVGLGISFGWMILSAKDLLSAITD